MCFIGWVLYSISDTLQQQKFAESIFPAVNPPGELNKDPTIWLDGAKPPPIHLMEQHALRSVDNCLNTNIYSYLETSGGQSSNL